MSRCNASLLLLAALAAAGPAAAYTPPTRVQNILVTAPDRATLRAQLRAFADSSRGRSAVDEGEAWRYLAESHWRAGEADSARAIAERAVERRGDTDERLLLADALLERGLAADLARVPDLMASTRMEVADAPSSRRAPVVVRLAWARQRAGDLTGAAELIADDLAWLAREPGWAARLAPALQALPARRRAWRTLLEAAVTARLSDTALTRLAEQAASAVSPDSAALVRARVASIRAVDQIFAEVRGGGRSSAIAGAPVWRLPSRGVVQGMALLLLPGRVGSIAEADSLIEALRAQRLDVLVVSAADLPATHAATAFGRETSDLRLAATLASTLAAETPPGLPVLVVSGEDWAPASARLARDHAPVRGVVLLSPWPAGPDRGPMAAALREAGVPVYVQTAPEAVLANEYADRLATLLPPRRVRVADGAAPGVGVALLRRDAAALMRVRTWVAESIRSPRATPPRRQRRG